MLVLFYGVLALVGLASTAYFNVAFARQTGGFSVVEFVAGGFANPSASSLTCDILVVAVAVSIWMVVEARRIGMRHGWAWPLLGWAVAMAFALPLFLAVRERRLTRLS